MSTTFGDFEADDAVDHEPPAPEQVAYRLHDLRREIDLATGRDPGSWDDLTEEEQNLALSIGETVVQWLLSHPNPTPEGLAESLHNVRRYLSHNVLPAWDDLDDDHRTLAVDLMRIILEWLRRQGAIT
jgi:hypothetical protein